MSSGCKRKDRAWGFIVKNIVEKHGGKVTIASEEKVGTTATMTLPIEQKFAGEGHGI